MALRVTVVVGNPRPMSRTRHVAEKVVERLLQPGAYTCTVIDLAEHADEVFRWPSEPVDALNRTVAESDLAVIATPTYKASYTGLLKAFLDRYPAGGLTGVVTLPLHTGADLTHAMSPTVGLAPLLMELGAVVPGRGLYVPTPELDRIEELLDEVIPGYAANMVRVARVSAACRPTPDPLEGA